MDEAGFVTVEDRVFDAEGSADLERVAVGEAEGFGVADFLEGLAVAEGSTERVRVGSTERVSVGSAIALGEGLVVPPAALPTRMKKSKMASFAMMSRVPVYALVGRSTAPGHACLLSEMVHSVAFAAPGHAVCEEHETMPLVYVTTLLLALHPCSDAIFAVSAMAPMYSSAPPA